MKLSKLQQKLFDTMMDSTDFYLMLSEMRNDGEDVEKYVEEIRQDISTMDVVELRANIKVWEE